MAGLALSIWLELQVCISEPTTPTRLNCLITCEGEGSDNIQLDPEENLVTRTAHYVLRCHDQLAFPLQTTVHISNDIPLGRGLGSSGAAVVAGVMLANAVGGLGMTKDRMLDYALMVERHPDNVAASLYGGFCGTYLSELDADAMARIEVPRSEILPEPGRGVNTGLKPPVPPFNIGRHVKFNWSSSIKTLVIIPNYEVKTADARNVLPDNYARKDVTFNMQRVTLLTYALGQSPPQPAMIYEAMMDKIHQPYRQSLVPGLEQLRTLTPECTPGLLGICLSGAGPSILILATHNFEQIAHKAIGILESSSEKQVSCEWRILEPAESGATLEKSSRLGYILKLINRAVRIRI